MLATYSGDNSYELNKTLRAFISAFEEEHGALSVQVLDGEDNSFEEISGSLSTVSFLVPKQLVVLKNPSKNKKFIESYEELLTNIAESNDVVIVEPKLDKRQNYYKYVTKRTAYKLFSNLDPNNLQKWVLETVKEKKCTISSSDARYLIDRVGPNQQLLSHELDKLMLYNSHVTRETIDLLTESNPQSTAFQLVDAAFTRNDKRVLDLYEQQRSLRIKPPQIIALLVWQLQAVSIMKTAAERSIDQIAKDSGVNPYVLRKSQGFANKLSVVELRQYIAELLALDVRLKQSNIDADDALKQYLLSLGK
jgi:DNA polymerase-3 subunit delta